MQEKDRDLIPASAPIETGLDVASFVTSAVPWIGGPVSNVLSGASFGRKLGRVREVLTGLTEDLREFQSGVSENYVKTEECEELLEQTLKRACEERHEGKRRLYRSFLTDAIKSPGETYDEQLRLLRTIEQLQPDHFVVLRALNQPPSRDPGMMGSPGQTLQRRLPKMDKNHIAELVTQLNDYGITNLTTMDTMMTGHGAENVGHSITPYGQRLLQFVLEA